jgi:hypothetical protein
MKLFKVIINWNDNEGGGHLRTEDNKSVGFYPAENRAAMEAWAAWYVGHAGTFEVESTDFMQFDDNTGSMVFLTSQLEKAEKYADTHCLVSSINNAYHPEIGEYVDFEA